MEDTKLIAAKIKFSLLYQVEGQNWLKEDTVLDITVDEKTFNVIRVAAHKICAQGVK